LKENVEKRTENMSGLQPVGMDEMKQRNLVCFMRLKGLSKKVIHHELIAILQENAVSSSNMTRSCKEAILGLNSEQVSSRPKDDDPGELNEVIMLTLSNEPFSSVRQIARRICVPNSTGYRRLVDSFHFIVRHQTSSFGSSEALRQS
jgi:hypothetical protein